MQCRTMKKRQIISILIVFVFVATTIFAANTTEVNATSKSSSEAISWVQSQVGKYIDWDGAYGAQCVDLIAAYYSYLGTSTPGGNGCDYATNALPSGWSRVKGGQPQKGDILVYSGNASNPYGHVAIYESDRVHYHQNFNSHSYVEKVTYMYNGLSNAYWGYIRPNWNSNAVTTISWGDFDCQPDNSNAFIYTKATASYRGTFTQAGAVVWNSAGQTVASKTENINTSSSYLEVWYNITNEMGVTLTSGTNYTYQYWVIFDGTKFLSPIKSFKTSGAAPCTHSWDNGTVTKAATCVATGIRTYKCTKCGATKTGTISVSTTHSWNSGTVTKSATCTTTGVKTYKCTNCTVTKTESIPVKGHSFAFSPVVKGSFNRAGVKMAKCNNAGCSEVKTEAIPAVNYAATSPKAFAFNNKNRTPEVVVYNENNDVISFEAKYPAARKKVGKHAVKVTLTGSDYEGTKTVYFKINPAGKSISKLTAARKSFTVKWKKPTLTYRKQMTGYQIKYSTSSNMKNAKTVTVKSTTATSKKISKLKAKKKYYVQLRTYKVINGEKYCSAWSSKKSIKVK